jgi:hypothetical protein
MLNVSCPEIAVLELRLWWQQIAESLDISEKDVLSLDLYSASENSEDYPSKRSCGHGECYY